MSASDTDNLTTAISQLQTLYTQGSTMHDVQVEEHLNSLVYTVREMVRQRRSVVTLPPSQLLRRIHASTAMRTSPQFVEIREQEEEEVEASLTNNYKIVTNDIYNSLCQDTCAICLSNHTNGETILTECGHYYGKECWCAWIENVKGDTCPTCRALHPKTTCFILQEDSIL